jgi:LytS/YehU family sensor histidine kinase
VAFKQQINIPLIVTIGIVSGIVLLVLIVGTQAWYEDEVDTEAAAKALEFPNKALIDMKSQQKANIETARWVDRKNNVVAIPVEDAMKIMVATQGKFPTTEPSPQ